MRDTIERDGRQFRVSIEYDQDIGAPWKEDDGHGPVSEWTRRDKRPGELVLCSDHGSKRYYDLQEAQAIALRDGWGPQLPGDTKRQTAARAAREDFERLRRWCNDDWYWCSVLVTLLDEDGEDTDETESLGGIESDAGAYLEEVAGELADEILHRLAKADELEARMEAIVAGAFASAIGMMDATAEGC